MSDEVYVVATVRPWNIRAFSEKSKNLPGCWHLISDPAALTVARIKELQPRYIFFPHWNSIVPEEILQLAECVCFHMTDLPYGRGGSPLQNLIARGHRSTVISALRMVKELDAGPIYFKLPLSLEGLAEEIFIRASQQIFRMIEIMVTDNPQAVPQTGDVTTFSRRTPEQSRVSEGCNDLQTLFDHLRMLDAKGYPAAFLDYGNMRLEFSRPALKDDCVIADVKISLGKGK